jgi:hypothetical protein
MKYGVKFYSQVPNPDEVPDTWPAISVKYEDDDIKTEQSLIDFTIMTEEAYNTYVAVHQSEYDAWAAIHLIEDVRQAIRDQIDIKTGELIEYGFPYELDGKSLRIRCMDEDQRNYLGLVIGKDGLEYTGPNRVIMKGYDENNISVYANFANSTEVLYFFITAITFVNNCLNDGWKIKDKGGTLSTEQVITTPIKDMAYNDLLNFVDPRIT